MFKNLFSKLEERKTYASNFLRLVNSEQNILFFDQTGFDISMHNNYIRSIKGRRVLHVVPALKSRNRSFVCLVFNIVLLRNSKIKLDYYKI